MAREPSTTVGAVGGNGRPVLSDRDLEALRHLAEGRSTRQIAAAMATTTNTVRTRIRRLQDKLAADHRHEVVPRARIHGLL
jgi:DNA-binding CsgD family transcriptional regulator